MSPKQRLIIDVLLIAFVLSGCGPDHSSSLPTVSPRIPGLTATLPQSVPTQTVVQSPSAVPPPITSASPVSTPGADTEPPLDFSEVLATQVNAGNWSLEQGLIALLQFFVGERSDSEMFQQLKVAPTGAQGVLEQAHQFLVQSPDTDAKTEVSRLLTLLSPSNTDLNAVAVPKASGAQHLAAPLHIDCEAYVPPTANSRPTRTSFPCLEYQGEVIKGKNHRIFYPRDTGWIDANQRFLDATIAAVRASVAAYSQLIIETPHYNGPGIVPDTNLIFGPYSSASPFSPTTSADTFRFDPFAPTKAPEPCPILIYPRALVAFRSLEEFQQVIAHELFHCFQAQNFFDQTQVFYTERKWWAEGTAEYFSNVVYPNSNEEYYYIQSFDKYSNGAQENVRDTAILDFTYEDFLFFQSLANQIGNDGIMKLLRSLPTSGGRAEQIKALAAFPNMQDLFHSFAQSYLDAAILDTNKQYIPVQPDWLTGEIRPPVGGAKFKPVPFAIRRVALLIEPTNSYKVSLTTSGGEGRISMRTESIKGSWTSVLPVINCGGERLFLLLMTSTAADQETYRPDVSFRPQGTC